MTAHTNGSAALRLPRWVPALGLFTLAFMIAAQVIAFAVSPPDRDMGNLQKIMYIHVPAAWMASVASVVLGVASVLYLWRRREKYDQVAASAAEAGAVLTGLTLLLGMIWGKPTWGIWWTWDARLTFTAVLFMIYVGYLSLRAFTDDDQRRAVWSAAVGILAAIDVLIVYKAVDWWRTLHQPRSSPETVDPAYALGLRLNAFAFLFLLIFFIVVRYHTARLERAADERAEERALAESPAHV